MKSVIKRVAGRIVTVENLTALLVRTLQPDLEALDLVYLRFAFVTRGPGDHIFPAFVLDDWGREIRGMGLYAWVRENGDRFPRGEIFGFEQDGRETQCFLRELELYARLPTYVYESGKQAVQAGHQLNAVLLHNEHVKTPERIAKPHDVKLPLSAALINWWHIPVDDGLQNLDFLQVQPDPGY
ncbi:MAG: hypothetical protein R3293_06480 [Candidatus Promineifilaceae bacterium]|nr:hypothetical protein [Candidatus Promineifilaceae bacterium]